MREASTWPWMDVECAEAEDRFDYLPVLLLKADRFVSATPWSKPVPLLGGGDGGGGFDPPWG